ncbi:hypothetical protein RU97_GL000363 [Enterococcus canis]|uniref:Hydrophobic protein n=1 Tax=Enterococcus canis TaxID=214095 RepID=A0A1L8RK29_9ENTE|nr:hypothetical protein [Enterococcus canis]OJG20130.1 hypothetical protein RU97_GL000363 [Enterococcus canis]
MFSIILLLFLVIIFSRKTFAYEKVTRVRFWLIPLYGVVMTIYSFDSREGQLGLLFAVLLAAIVIGYLETLSAKTSKESVDVYGRPMIKVKKGLSFIIGWLLVFILGAVIEVIEGKSFDTNTFIWKVIDDIEYDTMFYKVFATHNTSRIWLLVSVSSLAYLYFLNRREPALRQAIGRKPKKST